MELVEVIINCPLALKVGGHFQDVDGSRLRVEWHEVLSELFFEVQPIDEAEVAGLRFLFEFAGHPVVGMSSLHVKHGPDDFGKIIFEHLRTEADVGSARS